MKNSKTVLVAGFVSIIFVSSLFSACSHEIKIVGDKDKPIPINAEIKIQIYLHAEDNVSKMMDAIDDEVEESDKSSKLSKKLFYAIANFGVSTVYAAENSHLNKAINLYKAAYPYLKKQILGENRDGYVSVVNKSKKSTDGELKEATKIADKVNSARKALYQSDAKAKNVTIREIQTMYAKAFRKKSKKGSWIEVKKDGKWMWKQKN